MCGPVAADLGGGLGYFGDKAECDPAAFTNLPTRPEGAFNHK